MCLVYLVVSFFSSFCDKSDAMAPVGALNSFCPAVELFYVPETETDTNFIDSQWEKINTKVPS